MERALSSSFENTRTPLLLTVLGILAFAAGMVSEAFDLRFVALALFGAVAGLIVAAPYTIAIRILFVYLGFEGMAKLLSNYNPVVHVGADLLVLALVMRWTLSLLLRRSTVPWHKPPLIAFFALHFCWFLVEFANPYSLGLIPSIAGAKLYISMVTLYAFGYYLAKTKRDIHWFMAIWVFTLVVQVATGLYQSAMGAASVISLSPYYAKALSKFDLGTTFRPFGTTNLPGAPAIFAYLASTFVLYFLITTRRVWVKFVLAALLPLTVLLLMVCQIRSALLKAIVAAGIFVFLLLIRSSGRTRKGAMILIPALVGVMAYLLPQLTDRWMEQNPDTVRGFERTMSLFDYQAVSAARQGAGDRILKYAQEVPFGAGLSRTGPAAGKFAELAAEDPFFRMGFFTDNFWAATIAEIGIPGSLLLTAIVIGILLRGFLGILRTTDPEIRILQSAIFCTLFAIVMGLWGAEGLLYNPEAAFFWFFGGVLMRLGSSEPLHL